MFDEDLTLDGENAAPAEQAAAAPAPVGIDLSGLLDFIRKPTGPGPVSDYMEHPLNFARSSWLARVIRGLTGLAGDLNFAIMDVALGLLERGGGGKDATS